MPGLRCGLIGCGTVGSGVVRLWRETGQAEGATLAAVAVRDRHKRRSVDLSSLALTTDALGLARDPAIGLVIEASGDAELGRALAVETLRRGTPFVTAGKELVVRHGEELERLAAENATCFRYEAAAGGALPIVALLRLGLSPGPVRGFDAVLSGTCNFVLTRMAEGLTYDEALALAREAGLAEPDSRRDTSGRDTADKLVVLARLVGLRLDADRVPVRGIDGLGPQDVAFARRRGLALRLLARLRCEGAEAQAWVAPALVPLSSPLAHATGAENAIVLDAEPVGTLAVAGPGAGSLPTAAAILADVRELARSGAHPDPRTADLRTVRIVSDAEPRRHYVTLRGTNGTREAALQALAGAGVAVEAAESPWPGRVQFLTSSTSGAVIDRALARFDTAVTIAIHDDGRPGVGCGATLSQDHGSACAWAAGTKTTRSSPTCTTTSRCIATGRTSASSSKPLNTPVARCSRSDAGPAVS